MARSSSGGAVIARGSIPAPIVNAFLTANVDDEEDASRSGEWDAPGSPAPAAAGGVDLVAELQKLGALKEAGILTDDEFAAAKAKLLG